jgi:hypothetical protein
MFEVWPCLKVQGCRVTSRPVRQERPVRHKGGLAPSAGWHFRRLAHFSHFAVDQNVTVAFEGNAQGWLAEIYESTLKSLGGTAGFV